LVKPLIVGLDIGTTSAIAIFDLKRNLLYTKSKKEFSLPEMVSEILKFGKPLIIATDKRRAPSTIAKISASFGCRLFNPDHDLGVEEKEKLVNVDIKSPHEKDALAAALFANKQFSMQFSNIDNALKPMGLSDFSDIVKEMIVNRKAKNISDALEKLKPKEKQEIKIVETNIDWKEKAEDYKRRFSEKDKSYDILKIYSEKIEEKVRSLEVQKTAFVQEELKKNEKARKDILRYKEIKARDILIKQLQFELKSLKNVKQAHMQEDEKQVEMGEINKANSIPIIIIDDFTQDNIVSAHKDFGLNDKIVWFKNTRFSKQAAKALFNFRPRTVIGEFEDKMERILHNQDIIVVSGIEPKVKKHFAYVEEKELENAVKASEKQSFLKWLEEYKSRTS